MPPTFIINERPSGGFCQRRLVQGLHTHACPGKNSRNTGVVRSWDEDAQTCCDSTRVTRSGCKNSDTHWLQESILTSWLPFYLFNKMISFYLFKLPIYQKELWAVNKIKTQYNKVIIWIINNVEVLIKLASIHQPLHISSINILTPVPWSTCIEIFCCTGM